MIKNIVKWVNSKGNFKTSDTIIEQALWYYISCQMGVIRQTINIDDIILPLNGFFITIAGSSSGKSFSYEMIEKLFDINYEYTHDLIKERFKELNPKPIKIQDDLQLSDYIPTSQNTNIEGTAEGLYMIAQAISHADVGSVNILNEEILDVVSDSNLNRMKELWDGRFNAKVIKGHINKNLTGLFSNMLVFGSPIGIKKDVKVYHKFNQQLSSGIYRRSFIYYEEPQPLILNKNKTFVEEPDVTYIKDWMQKFKLNVEPLEMTADAKEVAMQYKSEMIDFVNENLDDDRYSAELGSYAKIIKLAGLHTVLYGKPDIDIESLEYAYEFYLKCRATVPFLFNTIPQHSRFYKVIKKNPDITKSEIFEKDIFDQRNWKEDIEMAKELAYRNNEILVEKGSNILKYSIDPLPLTKLDKLIVGVGQDNKGPKTIKFKPYEIPFNSGEMSLAKLVKSSAVDCFTTVHFDGTRSIKNAIDKQNLIAFDIDEGFSLEHFKTIFKDFKHIIYTTRNHNKDKKGIVAERFRIVIPTKYEFNVNNDKHSQMLSNIAESYDFPIYDSSTRNIDRLWFTNPDAEIFINDANELFDIIPYIPDTILREKLDNNLAEVDLDQFDKRVAGIIRWYIGSTYTGNRNTNTFRLMMFIKDLGGNHQDISYMANSKLIDPLSDGEFNNILRSVNGR